MRPRRLVVWIVVLVVAAVTVWAVVGRRSDSARYAEVVRGRIEQSIETSGTLRPVETTVIRGTVSGIVDAVAVRAGDRVDAGDIVVIIDSTLLQRTVETAQAARDEAELALALARERAASGLDIDIAEAVLAAQVADSAMAALLDAESALAAAILVAPKEGTVLEVSITSGQAYLAGAPAVVIAGDAFEVAATLDQADLPVVAIGAAVRVIPDARPDAALDGTVTEIAPSGDQDGGTIRFAITVTLTRQPVSTLGMRAGMSAQLAIPSVAVDGALLVPPESVETIGRRSFVRVRRGDDDVQVEVSIGLRQGDLVQVAAGDLEAGDQVRVSS